jgi:hypothetical protein
MAPEPLYEGFATQEPSAAAVRQEPQPVQPRRTAAEQADFNARVAAAAEARRIELEKAEVDAAAAKIHDERVAQLEEDRVADEKSQAERQAAAERHAALMAHPHTQLMGILRDLRAPTALDINGRVGALHVAVSRLAQLVLEHTPPPPDDEVDHGQGNGIERRELAEGTDEQIAAGVGQQPEAWEDQRQQ